MPTQGMHKSDHTEISTVQKNGSALRSRASITGPQNLISGWRKKREATHCSRGHEFAQHARIMKGGWRCCRKCESDGLKRRRADLKRQRNHIL